MKSCNPWQVSCPIRLTRGVLTLSKSQMTQILDRLHKHGSVQVAALAADLNVSEVTVRRYLAQMESEGHLVRFYGGAIPPQAAVSGAASRNKTGAHVEEKGRIAALAAGMVRDGDTVALGAGTTVAAVCAALAGRRNLTVVTNAVSVAWELAHRPDVQLVVTGGVLRPSSYALTGRAAEQSVRDLFVDLAFVGADGVSPVHGFSAANPDEAHIHRALLSRAARAVVVADHSKWGRVAFAQIAQPVEVRMVITDAGAPPEMVEQFRRQSVDVILA